jgi:effector-binding domain-containing protein
MYNKIKEWADDNGLKAFRPSYAFVLPTNSTYTC